LSGKRPSGIFTEHRRREPVVPSFSCGILRHDDVTKLDCIEFPHIGKYCIEIGAGALGLLGREFHTGERGKALDFIS
jgi:hypothetical protein